MNTTTALKEHEMKITAGNVLDLVVAPAVDVYDDQALAELAIPARLAALIQFEADLADAEEARREADAEAEYELSRYADQFRAEEEAERLMGRF
jgi:hypothetical protein